MDHGRLQRTLAPCLSLLFAGAPAGYSQTLSTEDAVQVSVSGSVRSRLETLSGRLSKDARDGDHFLSLLTLVKAEADFGGLSLVGEVQDSRRLSGPANGGSPSEVDTLEPIQAYLSLTQSDPAGAGGTLRLDLGRFTMDVGSRRLVARARYRNQKTSFDGLRAHWKAEDGGEVTAFRVSPVIRQPMETSAAGSNKASLNETHKATVFSGVHLRRVLTKGVDGEGYVFSIGERDGGETSSRDRRLTTYGVRLRKAPAEDEFDFDLEWAHQTGLSRATSAPSDISDLQTDAAMSHSEIGLTLKSPTALRMSLHYDYASGDRDPDDSRYGRFDPLFGDRSFEFGPTSLWGVVSRSNLKSAGVRLDWRPSASSEAYVSLREIDLAESRDRFSGSGPRDRSGAAGKEAGIQLEGRLRWRPASPGPRFELGAAHLTKRLFLKKAPNSDPGGGVLYGYSAVTFEF